MKTSIVDIERLVRERGTRIALPFGPGVFDSAGVAEFDRLNFHDLHLAPRFADAARGRPDRWPVLWADVRAVLFAATRRINTPTRLLALLDAMRGVATREAGDAVDVTQFAERVICEPLVDIALAGLSPRARRAIVADQRAKIANVLHPPERLRRGLERIIPPLKTLADARKQIAAARAVKRHLRQRLSGRAAPVEDYADAVLTMIERLGLGRASYVMVTVLTAIAGAPGTVAACMAYELLRHPEYRDRVSAELAAVPLDTLVTDPIRAAPVSYRVIREAMRLWSFPLMIGRPVYRPFAVDGHPAMQPGEAYWISSYIMHRDPDVWIDPDRFDPDRWLDAGDAARREMFAPFGWGPRTCVGASLGLAQYFLFLRIALVEWDITLNTPGRETMGLDGIAAPEELIADIVPTV